VVTNAGLTVCFISKGLRFDCTCLNKTIGFYVKNKYIFRTYVILAIFLYIGNEILPCNSEYTKELCQPCYDDPKTSGPDL
jgi:hypothetical protein